MWLTGLPPFSRANVNRLQSAGCGTPYDAAKRISWFDWKFEIKQSHWHTFKIDTHPVEPCDSHQIVIRPFKKVTTHSFRTVSEIPIYQIAFYRTLKKTFFGGEFSDLGCQEIKKESWNEHLGCLFLFTLAQIIQLKSRCSWTPLNYNKCNGRASAN